MSTKLASRRWLFFNIHNVVLMFFGTNEKTFHSEMLWYFFILSLFPIVQSTCQTAWYIETGTKRPLKENLFWFKLYWNLFKNKNSPNWNRMKCKFVFPDLQLRISHHWFRKWLGTEQATSDYQNQRWNRHNHFITEIRHLFVNYSYIFSNLNHMLYITNDQILLQQRATTMLWNGHIFRTTRPLCWDSIGHQFCA